MDEQRIREIAATAFKARFGDAEIVAINMRPGFDHYDNPVVDVSIVYDGKVEPLNGAGVVSMIKEVRAKVQADPKEDPGFPKLRFIAKSEIGKRDPATI